MTLPLIDSDSSAVPDPDSPPKMAASSGRRRSMNPGGPLRTRRMGAGIAPLRPGRAGDPGGTAGDDRPFIGAILRPRP